MVVTEGMGHNRGGREKGPRFALGDARREYCHAEASKNNFSRLPEADREAGIRGNRLNSVPGIRDAVSFGRLPRGFCT
eukprot:3017510-Pyramimonas_sp.AAC.1